MNIWHVDNEDLSTLLLWKMQNDNFMVIQDGTYSALLCNPNYTLLDRKYIKVLEGLADQLTFREVDIFDSEHTTTNSDYIELNIKNAIDPASIHTVNSEGQKLWVYNGHLFVSSAVKRELKRINNNTLAFHQGFQMFAAN